MFERAVVLDREKHRHLRFRPSEDYSFAGKVVAAPLAASEFAKASREFPIAFSREGRSVPLVFMGARTGCNSYVTPDGAWSADYIPAHLRRYPFVLGDRGNAEDFFVMADLRGLYDGPDGEPLFPEDGNWKEGVLGRAEKFLVSFERELAETERLVEQLRQADVLVDKVMTFRRDGTEVARIGHVSVVDLERLGALDDATLAVWVRSGLMRLVTLHLESQANWERLV